MRLRKKLLSKVVQAFVCNFRDYSTGHAVLNSISHSIGYNHVDTYSAE